MTKVTNNSRNPRVLNTIGGPRLLAVGETADHEFSDGELAVLKADPLMSFGGKRAPAEPNEPDWKAKLQAVVDLFADPAVTVDNVEAAVKELLADDEPTVSLSDAVAGLDHDDDKQWTQAGKPSLEHLAQVTGAEVKRADVDALNVVRKTT